MRIKYTRGWLLDYRRRCRHGKCRYCNFGKFEKWKKKKYKDFQNELILTLQELNWIQNFNL